MSNSGSGDPHLEKLKKLLAIQDDIPKLLMIAGGAIETEARLSITRGSISGAEHVPSKPGEAPNRDTGVLDSSIETRLTSETTAQVEANAPYAVSLEFGTLDGRIAERPFMRPAAKKEGGTFKKVVAAAVQRRAKG